MRLMVTIMKVGRCNSKHDVSCAGLAAVIVAGLAAGIACWPECACATGILSPQVTDTSGQDYFKDAFTVVDLPSEDLVEELPELFGLLPDATQEILPALLKEVGRNVEDSYQKFAKIIASEQVTQVQCTRGHLKTTSRRNFTYLILPHLEPGQERIEEYRTDADGNPVHGSEARILFGEGFGTLWALLYPANQSGSRFRYLGEQRFGPDTAKVIGFAQRPGWSDVGAFETAPAEGRRALVLFQGLVWIDGATGKVLKMRADLLKPRLDVKLELQTVEIRFGESRVSDAGSTALWVPQQVTVSTVWNGQVFRDAHLYSNYRLPGSASKIEPALEVP